MSVAVPSADSLDRIATILQKELYLALRVRMTQLTLVLMTVIFTLIPLLIAYGMGAHGLLPASAYNQPGDAQLPQRVAALSPALRGLSQQDALQALLLGSLQPLFLMTPVIIPMIIAVYSVIGEKQTRSLEALLATPITTTELLTGKCLAAALPGILSGWVGYALFALLAWPAIPAPIYTAIVLRPAWLLALLLLGPAAAFLAVIAGLIVSSRATDPQAAQQVAGIIVLPVVALLIGQISGVVQLSALLVLVVALLLLALDAGLLRVAVRLFQRETILTRWK